MQILVYITAGIFLIFKILNNAIRISDTNVYFYTANQLLQGKLLYKDFIFTNLPLFPYISSIYNFLLGNRLELFYLTAAFEVVVISILIYKIIHLHTSNKIVGLIGQLTYLSTLIVAMTSDHQTGVFLASLFSVAGYYFYIKKRFILSGILLGLMIMTKAYYLPIFIGFVIYLLINKKKEIIHIVFACIMTIFVVMLPTILFAFPQFINNVIHYSFTRIAGIDKLNMYIFFVLHDPLVCLLILSSIFHIIKKNLLSFILITTVIFVLFMQSIYYLYLNVLIPFAVLEIGILYSQYHKKIVKYEKIIAVILIGIVAVNSFWYLRLFSQQNKVLTINSIITQIKSISPKVIYGTEEITTAFAYLGKIPMLNGLVDTNDGLFRKGILNAKKLTQDAIDQQALIVVRGFEYPEKHIFARLVGWSVDRDLLLANCKSLMSIPIETNDLANRVNIYDCKK